jgi:hypothetical protein
MASATMTRSPFSRVRSREYSRRVDVFDYDDALWRKLYEARQPKQFLAWCRYYASDHRPLWAQFDI